MGISVNLDLSALDALAERAENIGGALAKGAEVVAEAARASCPVDTGALRASISASADGSSASVTAGAPYAAYVEFGTCKMAAQPFLVPALLNNADAVMREILGGM